MEEQRTGIEEREEKEDEKIPFWQVFYDDVFLLFLLSVVIMAVSFTIWGLMEIANVPPHPALKP
jgi:hypothetical protein